MNGERWWGKTSPTGIRSFDSSSSLSPLIKICVFFWQFPLQIDPSLSRLSIHVTCSKVVQLRKKSKTLTRRNVKGYMTTDQLIHHLGNWSRPRVTSLSTQRKRDVSLTFLFRLSNYLPSGAVNRRLCSFFFCHWLPRSLQLWTYRASNYLSEVAGDLELLGEEQPGTCAVTNAFNDILSYQGHLVLNTSKVTTWRFWNRGKHVVRSLNKRWRAGAQLFQISPLCFLFFFFFKKKKGFDI